MRYLHNAGHRGQNLQVKAQPYSSYDNFNITKPTSTLKIRSIVAFEAQAVKSVRNMRLKYSCCGTKVAILGVLSVFCTVAAAPIKAPFQSFPSFRELDSFNLYDSHMNLQSINDVGVSRWTVTILFVSKLELSGSSQMQSDAPPVFDNKVLLEDKSQFSGTGSLTQSDANAVFQNMATALQPHLPGSDTLFVLPHWGSIPSWNKYQKIEFHYFVQQGLPLKSGTRTEKEFGTGYVEKNEDGTPKTSIRLNTKDSMNFYLVDFQMKRHDPYTTTDDEGDVVHKDIVAKLRSDVASLTESTLIYFPSHIQIPPWTNQRIYFDLFLTPHDPRGPPSSRSLKFLKKFGSGSVKQASKSRGVMTRLTFESSGPSEGTGDNFPVLRQHGHNNEFIWTPISVAVGGEPKQRTTPKNLKVEEEKVPPTLRSTAQNYTSEFPPLSAPAQTGESTATHSAPVKPETAQGGGSMASLFQHDVTLKNVDQKVPSAPPQKSRKHKSKFPMLKTNKFAATRSASVESEAVQGGGSMTSLFQHSDVTSKNVDQKVPSTPPQEFASTARDYKSKFPALDPQMKTLTATHSAPIEPETVREGGNMASSWSQALTSESPGIEKPPPVVLKKSKKS
ncbi:hypothetical protein EV361DRAFT_513045 [Lentinula raphanica]|nr:hypothetical protein EV361DRAFT_513045 [Lentinula raphanica]